MSAINQDTQATAVAKGFAGAIEQASAAKTLQELNEISKNILTLSDAPMGAGDEAKTSLDRSAANGVVIATLAILPAVSMDTITDADECIAMVDKVLQVMGASCEPGQAESVSAWKSWRPLVDSMGRWRALADQVSDRRMEDTRDMLLRGVLQSVKVAKEHDWEATTYKAMPQLVASSLAGVAQELLDAKNA